MTSVVTDLASELDELGVRVQQDHGVAASLAEFRGRAEAAERRDLAAQAVYLQARAELNGGRPDAALELIEVARGTWLDLDQPVQAGRTELGRMAVLDHLGRHVDALETGQRLLAQLAGLTHDAVDDEVIWMRGAAHENMGVALGFLSRQTEALDAFTAAEQHYRQAGRLDDVVRPLANRGLELVRLGRYAEAIDALDRASISYQDQGNHLFAARCLAWTARAHLGSGDFHAALESADAADVLLVELATSPEWARTQLIRAETLLGMNLLDEAGALYAQLVERFGEAGLAHDQAEALAGRARVLALANDTPAAAAAYLAAQTAFRTVGDDIQQARCRVARQQLTGDDNTAFAAALQLFEDRDRPVELAETLIEAIEFGHDLPADTEPFGAAATLIEAHGLAALRWRLSFASARRAIVAGERGAAIDLLRRALAELDTMRSSVHDPSVRMQFLEGRERVHHELVALLIDDDPEAALRVVSTARARTLVEQMQGTTQRQVRRTRAEAADATITYQFVGDELVAFVEEDGSVRAVRGLGSTRAVHRMLDQLRAQWRRFADPGLVARQPDHLLRATTDLLQRLYLVLIAPLDIDHAETLLIVPQGRLASVPFSALHDGVGFLIERSVVAMAPSASAADLAERSRRSVRDCLVLGVDDGAIPQAIAEAESIAATTAGTLRLGADAAAELITGDLASPDSPDLIHVASHGRKRPDNPVFSSVQLGDRWVTGAEFARSNYDGQLIVLSTCSSAEQFGGGSGEELDGLPRALLAAGAGGVVANLWPCADEASRRTMTAFHEALADLSPAAALRHAQCTTMRAMPHPYHWAASVWLGSPVPFEEML